MTPVDRLDGFDAEHFLAAYWQQRPCLIQHWVRPEVQSLTTLLELAEAHDLPSRLVSGAQQMANWTLCYGPLDPGDLPDESRDWTVLVQEMDKACPAVATILEAFRFLPDWMIDDVMISQAADGGSVGAHVDAYDVFLIQADGQRRWQLAQHFDPAPDPRFELALLAHWEPETELLAGPGDVLYLPAGVAHHGLAVGACQTWSVGLRTPSGPEMLFFLAEVLSEKQGPRLPVRPNPGHPNRIDRRLLDDTRHLLRQCLDLNDTELAQLTARYLTSWRLWPSEEDLAGGKLAEHLASGRSLELAASARLAMVDENGCGTLYVNGQRIPCPAELADDLAASRSLSPEWHRHHDALELLAELAAVKLP